LKKALTLIITAAVFAWIVSAASASYSSLDQLHSAKTHAKHATAKRAGTFVQFVTDFPRTTKLAKPAASPTVKKSAGKVRIVYVYVPAPAATATASDASQVCEDYNDDLVARGMNPVVCNP
jgi:hypothetical protein